MQRIIPLFLVCVLLAACGPSAVQPTAAPLAGETPAATQPAPDPTAEPTAAVAQPVALRIFCAGSLIIPFFALEAAYEAEHPEVDVQIEAHGSLQVIRHVTDIHEAIDVVATADQALLPMLMYETDDPDTGLPYADWNLRFASNRMVLIYAPNSQYADELTTENWVEIIARPRVRLGLADPRFDACGYRTLMILQLAESVYGNKDLFEDTLWGRFTQPIRAIQEDGRTLIQVPEVLEPRTNSTVVLRGSSIQLFPLLESGDLDYAFEYESVAQQHGLDYITLPDSLSLGSAAHVADYQPVAVHLDFRRFASVDPTFAGDLISYGLTIPTNAPHTEEAERFVAFMLGSEGQRIMEENSHPLLDPVTVDKPENLPASLQALCVPE
ncbi:MAG: tungstate ABC transporter substrate-binding protein WtpA [Anaerolineae bacterium]